MIMMVMKMVVMMKVVFGRQSIAFYTQLARAPCRDNGLRLTASTYNGDACPQQRVLSETGTREEK